MQGPLTGESVGLDINSVVSYTKMPKSYAAYFVTDN